MCRRVSSRSEILLRDNSDNFPSSGRDCASDRATACTKFRLDRALNLALCFAAAFNLAGMRNN